MQAAEARTNARPEANKATSSRVVGPWSLVQFCGFNEEGEMPSSTAAHANQIAYIVSERAAVQLNDLVASSRFPGDFCIELNT